MPQCTATKDDGSRCSRLVGLSQTLCYAHSPEEAEARSKNASSAAKAKTSPTPELREVKRILRRLYSDLEAGKIPPRLGATLVSVANAQVRAVALEAELTSAAELARRVERIETLERQAKRWAN